MWTKLILLAYVLQLAIAAPQLLNFKDGKFGVNFGGFHAEAGLGGLLTGNAAHGGLSASAGTPFGQRAGAGLGGSVDGNAAGVLYAGAEANPHTGAGAILGGDTSRGGYAGSQAFSGGRTVASTKNHIFPGAYNGPVDTVTSGPANDPTEYDGIQKVRPRKKYLIKPSSHDNSANKNSDHKATAKPHAPKRDDDISTAAPANHNGDSDDGTAAASTGPAQKSQRVDRPVATHVPDVPQPVPTKSAENVDNQQQRAIAAERAAAAPTIVVSRQRLRQKSRTRPSKRERQLQRQRERLLQAQQTNEPSATPTEQQLHSQYAAQAGASADVNANANANADSSSNVGVSVAHSKHLTRQVERQNFDFSGPSPLPDLNVNVGPAVVTSALNIPIGILRSLQESLGGLATAKQGTVYTEG